MEMAKYFNRSCNSVDLYMYFFCRNFFQTKNSSSNNATRSRVRNFSDSLGANTFPPHGVMGPETRLPLFYRTIDNTGRADLARVDDPLGEEQTAVEDRSVLDKPLGRPMTSRIPAKYATRTEHTRKPKNDKTNENNYLS